MRRGSLLLVGFVLCLTAAACGGGDGEQSGGSEGASADGSIRVRTAMLQWVFVSALTLISALALAVTSRSGETTGRDGGYYVHW